MRTFYTVLADGGRDTLHPSEGMFTMNPMAHKFETVEDALSAAEDLVESHPGVSYVILKAVSLVSPLIDTEILNYEEDAG